MKKLKEDGSVPLETIVFEEPVMFEPVLGKAKTLSVSAVLKYSGHTLLHCSTLIEGNS